MFCPKCSQPQTSEDTRFCSRCGMPLDGVSLLLSNGGVMPAPPRTFEGELPPPSPRLLGMRQGGKLMLLGMLVVPLLILFTEGLGLPEEPSIAAAVLFFIGGFVRMLYALLFEDGPLRRKRQQLPQAGASLAQPPQFERAWARQDAALPPARDYTPAGVYAPPRVTTTDALKPPPSVAEGTTRLLDKE